MTCSIRVDGSTACMTIEGATDAEVFRAYVTDENDSDEILTQGK